MNNKILNELTGKYKVALLTTFNFDLQYFDNIIFSKLFVNGIKYVSVFVDSKQLQESLSKHNTNLGVRYSAIQFKMDKSFHPKVVLLLGENNAKLIVGSLNLTEKGYYSNQEIYNSFEYDKDNTDNLSLIIDAYNFFKKLYDLSDEKDLEIFKQTEDMQYLFRNVEHSKTKFIDNLDKSIFELAISYIDEPIKKVEIAVPYYDNEASALMEIEKKYPNIKLYVQNDKSTFPKKLYDAYKEKIFKFKKILCNESGNFYHGKVYRFITDKSSYILYGSANCTNAAFLESYADGGNVECDILEKGSISEYDELFLQFEEDKTEFNSYPIHTQSNEVAKNFVFDKINKDKDIECLFKYRVKKNNLQIFINDVVNDNCKYFYNDDYFVICIPSDCTAEIGNVFKVSIFSLDDNIKEDVNCFYNDLDVISGFRNSVENSNSVSNRILFKNDFYLNDIIDLMYQMPNNVDDLKNVRDVKRMYYEQKTETEESETDDEYFINEEALLDYKKKYEETLNVGKAVHKIGGMCLSWLQDIINFGTDENEKNNPKRPALPRNNNDNVLKADLTDEELELFNRRKGKKIVIKIINGITTTSYKDEIDYSSYKDYVLMLFYFLDRYTDYRKLKDIELDKDEKKEYLFNYVDVASYKFELVTSLCELLSRDSNLILKEKDDILLFVFQTILQKKYAIDHYGVDEKYGKNNIALLLEQIDELYNIRDEYTDYVLNAVKVLNYKRPIMGLEFAKSEIESLFKYKSMSKIYDLVKSLGEYPISIKDGKVNIIVKTNEIFEFIKFDAELLFVELDKYFKNKYNQRDNINEVVLNVEKDNINMNLPNPIIKVLLVWDCVGFRKTIIKKKHSSIEEEKKWN